MKKLDINKEYKKIEGIPVKSKFTSQIAKEYFLVNGKINFKNVSKIRDFAHIIDKNKIVQPYDESNSQAGELNAIALINEIYRKIMLRYCKFVKFDVFSQAWQSINFKFSKPQTGHLLAEFKQAFNTKYHNSAKSDLLLQELINLWLLNSNTAIKKYRNLFDDRELHFETIYLELIENLISFFDSQPAWGKEKLNLLKLLRLPSDKFPHSIQDQLTYIRQNWSEILGDEFFRLLKGIDLLKEENKFGIPGPGVAEEYDFGFMEDEPEQFSQDLNWMPKVVMIAKSTYVWLDQLSKKYTRKIENLHEIPNEELQLLAERGFTSLWLIGIWERSQASQRIKNICGNSDSIASAYSLSEYVISKALGGEQSFIDLKTRCWKFGIRLASDMVPNHTGIDSKWLIEHPNWFVQLNHSPFPNYTFNGTDLSPIPEIEIKIEDHYYDKTDAAVIFLYLDKRTGRNRFIYHGNDGTSFPWNDTAQLNYMLPEVREAVINQIIEVAKKTPIIRFDAAMTLAKKHFQRLWFPEPGSGGDIPTRSEFGMSKKDFNKLMPVEFWREVVDRIAKEAPDTLLLAEAFWMMEGYFVRTLGMHRVYNSAFMHMLKDEENAKYRKSIFNVIEFNPEILKRFVNFMSNPDEETAIRQFGSEDKYFGVCLLMSTMPGLPMFAHGQIEGFSERYGMEFSKPKWNEQENKSLVNRHEKIIFPILKKRKIFAEVENFFLYDFLTEDGNLNENVFVYSNSRNNEHSLIVYNNKFENTSGWIKYANAAQKDEDENPIWYKKTFGEIFSLHNDENYYLIFKDQIRGEYLIRNSKEIYEKGIFENLDAYKYKVYLDFYEVLDTHDKVYKKLSQYLQGGTTKDINSALRKTYLLPIFNALGNLINEQNIRKLISLQFVQTNEFELFLSDYLMNDLNKFYSVVINYLQLDSVDNDLVDLIIKDLIYWMENASEFLKDHKITQQHNLILILQIIFRRFARIGSISASETDSCIMMNDLLLFNEIPLYLRTFTEDLSNDFNVKLEIAIKYFSLWKAEKFDLDLLNNIFDDKAVRSLLRINKFNKIWWYKKESFLEFINILIISNHLGFDLAADNNKLSRKEFDHFMEKINKSDEISDCKLDLLIDNFVEN